jgi:hypothetical protein
MGNTKRCSGYKGHWECSEEYPNHEVPVENFGPDGDGLQGRCRKCQKYLNDINNPINNPKSNPIGNAISKEAYSYVGGGRAFYALDAETRKEVRAKARVTLEAEGRLPLIIEQPSKVVSIKRPTKGAPMRKRVGDSTLEGDVVPEGWVYVIKNPMAPFVLKIGRTYPDGIESRLSEARRWGEAKLVAQIWFDEVNDAEREIHRMLNKYNMRTLGYTDVGKELFKCSLKDFYRAVQQHTLGVEDENAISKS